MNISLAETAKALSGAGKLVLTAHVNPDGDAIGSALGLGHVLRGMGKDVQVFIDDDIPAIFSVLPGYEVIERPEKETREEKIKADLGVTSRCIPFEQEQISGTCVCCGKPAKKMVYWANAY